VNLSLGYGNQNLWTVILTSLLGFIMQSPKINLEDVIKDQKTIKMVEVEEQIIK